MNAERPEVVRASRKLDFGDDSDCRDENVTKNIIIEEMRKDQAKSEEEYNFDFTNEVPLPGIYSYRYENGVWIGTLNKTDDEKVKIYKESSEEDELNVNEAKTPASKGTSKNMQNVIKGNRWDSDNDGIDKERVSKNLF